MKAQILIVPSIDSTQINRIKNLFEAGGYPVAVVESEDMKLLNDEFSLLPLNKKKSFHMYSIL